MIKTCSNCWWLEYDAINGCWVCGLEVDEVKLQIPSSNLYDDTCPEWEEA